MRNQDRARFTDPNIKDKIKVWKVLKKSKINSLLSEKI